MAANPGGKRLRKCWEIPPFPRIRPLPGERATRPRVGTSPRPPLSESGIGGISFAGDTEGPCVRRAWHGRGAVGGRVAHCRAGAECRAGHTGTGMFSKIHLDIIMIIIITTIATDQILIIRMVRNGSKVAISILDID